MTSPIVILCKARLILERQPFCLYRDPRFPSVGIARRADGIATSPSNRPAVMFTLTGAVARAIVDYTGRTYEFDEHNLFQAAMRPLWAQVSLQQTSFLRHCDNMGVEKCLQMITLVTEIERSPSYSQTVTIIESD